MPGSLGSSRKTGDRIRLISMSDAPDPVPAGTLGVVPRVIDHGQRQRIEVAWDDRRKLMRPLPEDCVAIVGQDCRQLPAEPAYDRRLPRRNSGYTMVIHRST